MDEEVLENQVSRRRMLKRIGAGAAIAWSAPIITSIGTPAFAQNQLPCSPCTPEQDCNAQVDCSSAQDGSCCCGRTPRDTCFCYQHGACGIECASQSDCDSGAPGTTCVASCCGFTCLPPCTTGPRRNVPRGQRSTYRR